MFIHLLYGLYNPEIALNLNIICSAENPLILNYLIRIRHPTQNIPFRWHSISIPTIPHAYYRYTSLPETTLHYQQCLDNASDAVINHGRQLNRLIRIPQRQIDINLTIYNLETHCEICEFEPTL